MKGYIYKIILIGTELLLLLTIFIGCGNIKKYMAPKTEFISYDERIFVVTNPAEIIITGQTGNIEVYNCDDKEVKFEITKKIKGFKDESINDKLENIRIITNIDEERNISFEWKYEGSNKELLDKSIDLKIYLPKKVQSVKYRLDIGKIKIFDDAKYDILADLNMANIEINKFEGRLNLEGEMSNLKISGGLIKSGSVVKLNMGNINIKAECETNGCYEFQTKMGNIDLALPLNSKVSFENDGYVQINEFETEDHPTKIKLGSEMGRICINKY